MAFTSAQHTEKTSILGEDITILPSCIENVFTPEQYRKKHISKCKRYDKLTPLFYKSVFTIKQIRLKMQKFSSCMEFESAIR